MTEQQNKINSFFLKKNIFIDYFFNIFFSHYFQNQFMSQKSEIQNIYQSFMKNKLGTGIHKFNHQEVMSPLKCKTSYAHNKQIQFTFTKSRKNSVPSQLNNAKINILKHLFKKEPYQSREIKKKKFQQLFYQTQSQKIFEKQKQIENILKKRQRLSQKKFVSTSRLWYQQFQKQKCNQKIKDNIISFYKNHIKNEDISLTQTIKKFEEQWLYNDLKKQLELKKLIYFVTGSYGTYDSNQLQKQQVKEKMKQFYCLKSLIERDKSPSMHSQGLKKYWQKNNLTLQLKQIENDLNNSNINLQKKQSRPYIFGDQQLNNVNEVIFQFFYNNNQKNISINENKLKKIIQNVSYTKPRLKKSIFEQVQQEIKIKVLKKNKSVLNILKKHRNTVKNKTLKI